MPRGSAAKGATADADAAATAVAGCPRCSFDDDSTVAGLRKALLSWYDGNQRALPWRHASTPAGERAAAAPPAHGDTDDTRAYAVLVSEVMLQQTQVATVVDYFTRWMAKWPTVEALAAAPLEHVNEAWAGLGYYSRARRLHEAAGAVVAELGGHMPRTAAGLRELPGVGPYTAAAVASIAFGEVTGLVDGNVIRVLTRLRGITASPKADATTRRLWDLAHRVVDPARPGDFNQALMELGATVCTPKKPGCAACPVRSFCRAREMAYAGGGGYGGGAAVGSPAQAAVPTAGEVSQESVAAADEATAAAGCSLCAVDPGAPVPDIESFPFKAPKKKATEEAFAVVVPRRGGDVCIRRRPDDGLLGGMWEFFTSELPGDDADGAVAAAVRRAVEALEESGACGPGAAAAARCRSHGTVTHVFSHRRHTYHVHELCLDGDGRNDGGAGVKRESGGGNTSGVPGQSADAGAASSTMTTTTTAWRWVSETEFQTAAVSTNMRKVHRACAAGPAPARGKRRAKAAPDDGTPSVSKYFKVKTTSS